MTPHAMTDSLAYNFNIDTSQLIPHAFDIVRESFMHELARTGDLLCAEVIFQAGNPIDLADDLGRRPLHEAAFFGHLDMVKFLLDNDAVMDAPIHPFGHTALYLAVQQNRYDIVQHLIERGANLNVNDTLSGSGLLHIAAAKGDIRMTGILIAAGIDVFAEDKKGMTGRDRADQMKHAPLAKILLKVMEHHARR